MTSREAEARRHAEFLDLLTRALDIGAVHATEQAAVEQDARSSLDRAMRAERDTRDQLAAAAKALEDASQRSARLVARAGAEPAADAKAPPPERVADFERATTALLADLRSAEAAWDWVERARQAAVERPQPAGQAPILPTASASTETHEPSPSGRGCSVLFLAIFANLGLAALVLAILTN